MIQAHVKAFLAIFLIAQVHGIKFYLEPNSHKCLKEEVNANVLVTGEYELTGEAMGQKTNYVVGIDPDQRSFILHPLPKHSCQSIKHHLMFCVDPLQFEITAVTKLTVCFSLIKSYWILINFTSICLLQIQDSKGHILSQKEDIPVGKLLKFSFVTETYDTFEICFISRLPSRMYI